MGGMNHRRPLLKVMDAGGGDRVRTIAEDLSVALAADRESPSRSSGARCGACGSRTSVTGTFDPRCPGCRAGDLAARAARKAAFDDEAARATVRRARLCSGCHTELPVSGACGFCT